MTSNTRVVSLGALLTIAMLATGCTRPLHAVLASGDRMFEYGDVAGASVEYATVTARDPGHWWAHYRLGVCQTEMGKTVEARRHLQLARTLRTNEPLLVDALAEAMYRGGDEVALFTLVRDDAELRRTVAAFLRYAHYADLINDPDSARYAFSQAINMAEGRDIDPYLLAAAYSTRIGDVDEAVRLLMQAYEINPRDQRIREQIKSLGQVPGPTLAAPAAP